MNVIIPPEILDEHYDLSFVPEPLPPEKPPVTIRNEQGEIDHEWRFVKQEVKLKNTAGKNAIFIEMKNLKQIFGFEPSVLGIFKGPSGRTNTIMIAARR